MAAVVPFIPYIAMAAATIFSVAAQRKAGKAQEAAAERQAQAAELNAKRQAEASEFEAQQLDQMAGQERAASQHRAQEERRRSDILQSRARAVAAASGGGASDPTVVDIISDLAGEGEYLAATHIFEGQEAARRARMGAAGARFEGRTALEGGGLVSTGLRASGAAARSLSRYNIGATIFGNAASAYGMYGKYGMPSRTPTTTFGS